MEKVEPHAPRVEEGPCEISTLDALAREGARRMIAAALEVEVAAYVARHRAARDADGRALVVRNGRARPRKVTVGSGTIEVVAPRVNDRRVVAGTRQRFTSQILPPYARRSPKVTEVLPLLYLRGLSTGDFREALPALLGADAAGLSPSAITRLTTAWQDDYKAWKTRSFAGADFVYVWVDGVHFNVRLEDDRLAALVVVGARPDGTKEVLAIEDGFRESTESWLAVLRDLKARGLRAPAVAVGDGALGFWAALRQVFPETMEQRCWVHQIANVLDKLPRSLQPRAKAQLHAMMTAPTRAECVRLMATFGAEFRAKYPKAVASLEKDPERLLALYALPAEHWKHLRSTNPIESTFATVKLRTRATRGAGSRNAALAMAFKLLLAAQARWRRLDAPELLPLVRAGVKFEDGVRLEREDTGQKAPPRRVRGRKDQPRERRAAA